MISRPPSHALRQVAPTTSSRPFAAAVKSRFLRIRAGDRRFFDRDTSVSVGKANKRRHHNMAAKDGFPPPPSHQPETLERPGPGTAWDEAVTTPRILKAGILGVTMT